MKQITIDMLTNDTAYIEERGGAEAMVEKATEYLEAHGYEDGDDMLWEQMLREMFP